MEDKKEGFRTTEEVKKQVNRIMNQHKELDMLMNGMVLGIITMNSLKGTWRFAEDGNLEKVIPEKNSNNREEDK